MSGQAPAKVGDPVNSIDTPALLIELDAFERNLQTMACEMDRLGVKLRPHAKTHKSAIIASKQIALGAVGVCCQTVAEADMLVCGGIGNVLISNQVVGEVKIDKVAALAKQAQLAVCVDNADNIRALGCAAQQYAADIGVLVEIEVGMGRCGVPPGQPALDLALLIESEPNLTFKGLQAYQGAAQHIRDYDERSTAIKKAAELAGKTKNLLHDAGLACEIIGGGGTGTYEFEASSGVYNELQAGSYIFMDADYGRNKKADGTDIDNYENSLFVLTTVISRPTKTRAIVDAGLKAHSVDSGPPLVRNCSDIHFISASDEHGIVELGESDCRCYVGDKLQLIPGHCDPTVNLHTWYIGIRDGRVEELWPIADRV